MITTAMETRLQDTAIANILSSGGGELNSFVQTAAIIIFTNTPVCLGNAASGGTAHVEVHRIQLAPFTVAAPLPIDNDDDADDLKAIDLEIAMGGAMRPYEAIRREILGE